LNSFFSPGGVDPYERKSEKRGKKAAGKRLPALTPVPDSAEARKNSPVTKPKLLPANHSPSLRNGAAGANGSIASLPFLVRQLPDDSPTTWLRIFTQLIRVLFAQASTIRWIF
jgi:hypothetical protein